MFDFVNDGYKGCMRDDDAYIAEIMEQKKALGIDCPAIDHIEIVEISGVETSITLSKKEEKKMANDKVLESVFTEDANRLMDILARMREVVDDFYSVYDEPNKSAAAKRYLLRKEGQINGMCEAFDILFHTRIEWGREGIKMVAKEVK